MTPKLNSIMLVDDDAIIAFYNSTVIKRMGISNKIDKFYNAVKAFDYLLDTLEQNPENLPDLILLDLYMPRMNGWEFLDKFEKMKENSPNIKTKIVLCSSACFEEKEEALEKTKVDDFLEKPLTPEKINDLISKHFGCRYEISQELLASVG